MTTAFFLFFEERDLSIVIDTLCSKSLLFSFVHVWCHEKNDLILISNYVPPVCIDQQRQSETLFINTGETRVRIHS